MAKNDSSMSLWEKRKEIASPKQGPYADSRNQLLVTLAKAKQLSLLKEISAHTYELRSQNYLLDSNATIEMQVNFKTKELQIAVGVEKEGGSDTRYYNLTDSGYAVDLDGLSSEEEGWPYLEAAIKAILRDMQKKVDYELCLRQERRRTIKTRLIICAAILALMTLAFFCIRWWFFEPQEAANRARIAYNAENHQIDNVGYPVDSHALSSVPSGTLQAIPSYGGDDTTLTHPRTVSIRYSSSSSWCSDVKVDIPSGSALVVAAEDDSLFIHDHYVATYTNRTLTVCLVDGFTKNDASKGVVARLALQVKPQDATN